LAIAEKMGIVFDPMNYKLKTNFRGDILEINGYKVPKNLQALSPREKLEKKKQTQEGTVTTGNYYGPVLESGSIDTSIY